MMIFQAIQALATSLIALVLVLMLKQWYNTTSHSRVANQVTKILAGLTALCVLLSLFGMVITAKNKQLIRMQKPKIDLELMQPGMNGG